MNANPYPWQRVIERSSALAAIFVFNVALFLLLGTIVIYHLVVPSLSEPMVFVKTTTVPPPPKPPARGGEGRKSLLDPSTVVVPPQASLTTVVTANNPQASFTLNVADTIPSLSNLPSFANPQGNGLTSGSSSGGVPQTNPFGSSTDDGQNSNGLMGTLYDFTRDSSGQPTDVATTGFKRIVNEFVNNSFQPASPCYTSPNKLCINHLFVPITHDELAGIAFQSPESSHAFWVVHYQGTINVLSTTESEQVRFVGFGDNVLVVAIDGNVVLDASDLQYLHRSAAINKQIGGILLPDADNVIKPIFSGDSIKLEQGKSYKIDVLIGDEGGVTTSGLFLETDKDEPVTFSDNGAPKLPLFSIGPVGDADQKEISKYLPAECFQQAVVVKVENR